MSRYRPAFHILLSALMLFQAATVSGQVYCEHGGKSSEQELPIGAQQDAMGHHQHHAGMEDSDNKGPSGCACGFDCSGTCMHACQGFSLISHFDPTPPVKLDIQPKLIFGLADSGFTSLPLRPPIIS